MPAAITARLGILSSTAGHYILGKTIGEGTFGKVKLGTHILTGEKVGRQLAKTEQITRYYGKNTVLNRLVSLSGGGEDSREGANCGRDLLLRPLWF